jgi:hypothetical protein
MTPRIKGARIAERDARHAEGTDRVLTNRGFPSEDPQDRSMPRSCASPNGGFRLKPGRHESVADDDYGWGTADVVSVETGHDDTRTDAENGCDDERNEKELGRRRESGLWAERGPQKPDPDAAEQDGEPRVRFYGSVVPGYGEDTDGQQERAGAEQPGT